MSDAEAEQQKESRLLSGSNVAIASAGAYLFTFCYEVGYTSFFDIPPSLIRLDLPRVFTAFAIVLGSLIGWCLIGNYLFALIPRHVEGPVARSIFRMVMTLIVFLAIALLVPIPGIREFIWKFFVVVLVLEFGLPLLTGRRKATYREKLMHQEEIERRTVSLTGVVMRRPSGRNTMFVIFGIYIFSVICLGIGWSFASRRVEYLVRTDVKDVAVIRIYNDTLICMPFDRKTRQLERTLLIEHLPAEEGLMLKWEKVGPLKLASQE